MKSNEILAYRHGEIKFVESKIPTLEESKTDTIIKGSNNNPHTFKGGKLYLKSDGEYIIGYLKAKDTTLYHVEHGKGKGLKEAKLPDEDYVIRRAMEKVNKELKQVID
jgi:hypothetical protein